MEQHVEGLGNARRGHVVTLDDSFVSLTATYDVVTLDGEDLLQYV